MNDLFQAIINETNDKMIKCRVKLKLKMRLQNIDKCRLR